MNRVLITGGAGFIGRALVGQCLRAGHEVTVVDNFVTGKRENLAEFGDRAHVHDADILDAPAFRGIVARARPDVVFHLAAHHFIPYCNAHPQETLRTNVEGSFTVLSIAAELGVRCTVVASTGAIYPSVSEPLTVEMPPTPSDVYGLSKLLMEGVAHYVAGTTSMSCVIARLFNTYGPYETNPHLIPEIMIGLQGGNTLTLGNVDTKRDYVYVEDVAQMLLRCANSHRAGDVTVNIGTGDEFSAREIVHALGRLLGREIAIEIDPNRVRSVDKLHQRADLSALEALCGERPRIGLDDGLRQLAVSEGLLPGTA